MLEIYAGDSALKTIKEKGFSSSLFSSFLGASGGPKWFVLFELDKYIFGHFFKNKQEPLHIVGSSAGAFRAACFGQKDPVAAITRLAEHYSQTIYSNKPTPQEISKKARDILLITLGDQGANEIINNPIFKAHFIVTKSNGLVGYENKFAQLTGLMGSMVRNKMSRSLLKSQFERYIFQPAHSQLALSDPDDFITSIQYLTPNNLSDALLASGSIPLVMSGVKNIHGCPLGMYRDGGIIDYHFDLKIHNPELTLYPHFNATLKAGWFDKNSKRQVRKENYNNAVIICPSAKFIQTLPYQKIPDRSDFTHLPPQKRIEYWQQVFKESKQLSDSFDHFIQTQAIDRIQPMKKLIDN